MPGAVAIIARPSYKEEMGSKKAKALDAISGIASDCRMPCAHALDTAQRMLEQAQTLQPGALRDTLLAAAFEMAYVARHLGVVLSSYDERYAKARLALGLGDVDEQIMDIARSSGAEFLDMHVKADAVMNAISAMEKLPHIEGRQG